MGFKSSLIRSGTKLLQTFSGIDIGKSLGASSGSPDDGFDFRISPHLTGYDSPLLPGTTLWNLSSMGDLVIDGYNDGERYSITNISTRAKHIQMWGEGASPGGNGGYSYGDFNLTVNTTYIVDLNQGRGMTNPAPKGSGGYGGGYGGLFEGSVEQSNAIIMSGGGGHNSGFYSEPGGPGGGVPGTPGTPSPRGGGGSGGGSGNCGMTGGIGGSGSGPGNWGNGGSGGGGYCGGGGGVGGNDPGGGTQIASGGGGGSGYINPAYTSNGVTDFYPVGQSDPNRGTAGDSGGPARIVFSLP